MTRHESPIRVDSPAPPFKLNGTHDWAIALSGAAIALIVATTVLQLWNASLGVPWFYDQDNKLFLQLFHSVQTTGWWTRSDALGGGGVDLSAFPVGSGALLHLVTVRMMGIFVRDPIALYNLYFLLSFGTVSIAAFYALRRLGMQAQFSFLIAVLYSTLPYHFLRGHRGHIFLAAYAAVPLAAMLVVRHASGDAPLTRRPASASPGARRAEVLETIAIAALIGASTMYYAVMFMLLLLLVSLAVAIRGRSDAVFTSAFRASFATVVTLTLGLVPTLVTWAKQGPIGALARPYGDTELFSFRLVSGALPVENHRLDFLARLRDQIASSPVQGEGAESFGLIGVIGALVLVVFTVRGLLGATTSSTDHPLLRPLALCGLVGFLLATTGGIGALISVAGFSFVRSWARMGIFLSFFVLAAFGFWLQSRLWVRRLPRPMAAMLILVLLLIGVLDQTTPEMAPQHEELQRRFSADVAYVHSLAETLGGDAAVFQVPYMTYPENTEYTRVSQYEPLRWLLADNNLKWSFGTPPTDSNGWQRTVTHLEAPYVALSASILGYDALMIDRAAFREGAPRALDRLEESLGPPLLSWDRRYATFDLRRVPDVDQTLQEDLRALIVGSTSVRPGGGFVPTDQTVHQAFRAGATGTLSVRAGVDADGPDEHMSMTLRSLEGELDLSVRTPSGDILVTISEVPQTVKVPLAGLEASAKFDIEFEAEPSDPTSVWSPSWELVDVELPLEQAIKGRLSSLDGTG